MCWRRSRPINGYPNSLANAYFGGSGMAAINVASEHEYLLNVGKAALIAAKSKSCLKKWDLEFDVPIILESKATEWYGDSWVNSACWGKNITNFFRMDS